MKKSLPGVIATVLSLVLVGAGAVMLFQGLDAKAQVREQLAAEHITTPDDARVPGVPVDSAELALVQAEIIQKHTLENTDGLTWAQLDREDPRRAQYLTAVTLRTSLMSAYMAFKLADLVTGLGLVFLLIGLGGGAASIVALRGGEAAAAGKSAAERKLTVG